ncbi:MAG: hypothetical protein RLO50_00050 [Azospirillaceae bacterium]
MAASVSIVLTKFGGQRGIKGIDVIVGGQVLHTASGDGTYRIELPAGTHVIGLVLRGLATRRSKVVEVTLDEGEARELRGSYSILWGSVALKPA